MIEIVDGDLLGAKVDALVNAVNTVGVMGKGLALKFKAAFPDNFEAYARACGAGEVVVGRVFVHDRGAGTTPRYLINFPTKEHWRGKSKLSFVVEGLDDLTRQVSRLRLRSIAVPALGCGLGGLRFDHVRPLIERAFASHPDVHVLLYPPQ